MVIVHRSFRAAPSVERCRSTSLPANGTAHRGRLVQRSQGSRRTRQAVSRETSAPTGPHSCAALESDPRCFTWNTLAGRAVPLTVRFHDPGGPRSSSPRSASTWPSSQHQRTSCRGRSCHPKPSSPGRAPKPTRPAKGNRYLKGVLGEVAAAAARTDTFLGERYRRLVRRRGKQRAHPRPSTTPHRQFRAMGLDVTITPTAA